MLVCLSLLVVSTCNSQYRRVIVDPVANWLAAYQDTAKVPYFSDRYLHKLVGDFNNDGRLDIVITDPFTGGAQNLEWVFYLRDARGKYRDVGLISFEDIISIRPIKPGVALVGVFIHDSGSEGTIEEYRISIRGIKLVHSYSADAAITPMSDGPGPNSVTRFRCRVLDLLRDSKSAWEKL